MLLRFSAVLVMAAFLSGGASTGTVAAQGSGQPKAGAGLTIRAPRGGEPELRRIAATATLDPARTRIAFTLGAFLHTVHGRFSLTSGTLQFDPAPGSAGGGKENASGEFVINATSGETGNPSRDRTMRRDVLETGRFPTITFRATRVIGPLAAAGDFTVTLQGVLRLHGADHPVSLPLRVQVANGRFTAFGGMTVPYAAWGLKNPSTLLLRVGATVDVNIETAGTITWPPAAVRGR